MPLCCWKKSAKLQWSCVTGKSPEKKNSWTGWDGTDFWAEIFFWVLSNSLDHRRNFGHCIFLSLSHSKSRKGGLEMFNPMGSKRRLVAPCFSFFPPLYVTRFQFAIQRRNKVQKQREARVFPGLSWVCDTNKWKKWTIILEFTQSRRRLRYERGKRRNPNNFSLFPRRKPDFLLIFVSPQIFHGYPIKISNRGFSSVLSNHGEKLKLRILPRVEIVFRHFSFFCLRAKIRRARKREREKIMTIRNYLRIVSIIVFRRPTASHGSPRGPP